jgi:hypothetical protein
MGRYIESSKVYRLAAFWGKNKIFGSFYLTGPSWKAGGTFAGFHTLMGITKFSSARKSGIFDQKSFFSCLPENKFFSWRLRPHFFDADSLTFFCSRLSSMN